MKELKKYFREFKSIFEKWEKESDVVFVIGGIWALKLHGLNVRETADVDIIVYHPPQSFVEYIQAEVGLTVTGYPSTMIDGSFRRSWRVVRNGLTIDFITAWDEKLPENLLSYCFRGKLWLVQSVDIIIEKKKEYNRDKDLTDFENFKRDNF